MSAMALLDGIPTRSKVAKHRPWPRFTVEDDGWRSAIDRLVDGRATLFGLWGDTSAVHMALIDNSGREIAVLTYETQDGSFPSVGQRHPPAIRPERAIASLFGLTPIDAPDVRPWLDFGVWDRRHPLGKRTPGKRTTKSEPYSFLPAEGEGLHQIPVGPVHAGTIEPGHFRFTANGEHVVRLEQRLGYTHKGVEWLMRGATLEKAARLACRTSGDSAVAYGIAFAQAVEAALGMTAPPRALYLRALMAELERLAHHLGDIGAICNDASFAMMHAQCGILRERTLRVADACFGHRLMMDMIAPGGVTRDLAGGDIQVLKDFLAEIRGAFPRLVELYDKTASIQDRTVTAGVVKSALARQFGAGGYVGRAAGRAFDCRKTPGYAPYDALSFEMPVLEAGDVDARIWIRIREVEQSLSLIEQIVARMPAGALSAPVKAKAGEGLGVAEAFRGDVLIWVRLDDDGLIERCHLRDASWFQWPLLEAAIEGNIVADFPLCNKSFNCSYSGHDL
jgi:Ni,Fe-hydrogenase III large subunit/Ni,Fe-hydrogenase III component G